jgi:hypothetical protein
MSQEDIDMTMHTAKVSCVPGAIYKYYDRENRDGTTTVGGEYRLVGVGTHVHTHQQQVCYVGVGGRDDGLMYFCPLVDWGLKFTLVEPVIDTTLTVPAEKVISVRSRGSDI